MLKIIKVCVQKYLIFVKLRKKILFNLQTFFCFVLYCKKRRCSQKESQLKIEIESLVYLKFHKYHIQVCKTCKPVRPYVRLFDVTERTNRFRHSTRRRCYICGSGLMDTIVHFGERGTLSWPINWNGASRAAEKADMILCLGSSLKVNLKIFVLF